MNRRLLFVLFLLLGVLAEASATAQDDMAGKIGPAIAVISTRMDSSRFEVVGSGVFVRSDGILITANELVQGAKEIQVRLADGETYDNVEVVATDERRNIAVLRVMATSTPFVGVGITDETAVGLQVRLLYNAGGQITSESGGVLSSISLADEIPGAGTGFRVLKFSAALGREAVGGILLDNYSRVIGLIAPSSRAKIQNYAVPLYNVGGLVRSISTGQPTSSSLVLVPGVRDLSAAIPIRQPSTTPIAPMPQVAVPQRPTTALRPAGPGSVVIRESDPGKLFAASRTVYVTSYSNVFKSVQLLNELRKRHEFSDWGISFVDEREVADLILEIEHIPLTWEFPFSMKHQRTGIVVATGKVYAWGGGDGALLMAGRIVDRLTKLRAGIKTEPKNDATK